MADIDGDAKADLFVANLNLGSVAIFRGTGTGTFQPAVAIAVGSGRAVNALAVAAVNRHARPNIVTAYSNNNSVAVQLSTTCLANAAASQGQLTLAPNPTNTRSAMLAAGLPATVHTLEATLYSPIGQVVCQLLVPVVQGHAQAAVPTLGLASGVYVMHVRLRNAQGIAVGALPTQRLAIAQRSGCNAVSSSNGETLVANTILSVQACKSAISSTWVSPLCGSLAT